MKTITYDETKWQLVPRECPSSIAMAMNDSSGSPFARWNSILAAAPEPQAEASQGDAVQLAADEAKFAKVGRWLMEHLWKVSLRYDRHDAHNRLEAITLTAKSTALANGPAFYDAVVRDIANAKPGDF